MYLPAGRRLAKPVWMLFEPAAGHIGDQLVGAGERRAVRPQVARLPIGSVGGICLPALS